VPEKLQERLRTAKTRGLRVKDLVDQFLDLSKLKDDEMKIAAKPIDLSPFLERTADLIAEEAGGGS